MELSTVAVGVLCHCVSIYIALVDYVGSSREYELEKSIFFLLFLRIFLFDKEFPSWATLYEPILVAIHGRASMCEYASVV